MQKKKGGSKDPRDGGGDWPTPRSADAFFEGGGCWMLPEESMFRIMAETNPRGGSRRSVKYVDVVDVTIQIALNVG